MIIVRALLAAAWYNTATGFNIMDHLATSTPYKPPDEHLIRDAPANCTLLQVNMVLRHGTRQPTSSTIRKADRLHKNLQDLLAEQAAVPDWLMSWRPQFNIFQTGDLTTTGMIEHYELARRLTIRYPDVFAEPYQVERCRLRSTQKSRAGRSASSFAFGLWHGTGDVTEHRFEPTFIYTTGPLDDDIILRPFNKCPRYKKRKTDPGTVIHYRQYMGRISTEIVARVQERLGVRLDPSLIEPAWKVSKAELSALGSSNLSKLFDDTDVLALELGDDISTYWSKGPGHAINWQMMCPLLHDVLISMTDASTEFNLGRHRFLDLRFAHAETIIPLVTSLGLFQDDFTYTSDSDVLQMKSRSWRISRVSPFAANLAFHLYRCEGQFLVSILHNEQSVPMKFCSGQYFCPLKTFQDHLLQFTSGCNLTEMCRLEESEETCSGQDGGNPLPSSASFLALIATTIGLCLGTMTGFVMYKSSDFAMSASDRTDIRDDVPYRSLVNSGE